MRCSGNCRVSQASALLFLQLTFLLVSHQCVNELLDELLDQKGHTVLTWVLPMGAKKVYPVEPGVHLHLGSPAGKHSQGLDGR